MIGVQLPPPYGIVHLRLYTPGFGLLNSEVGLDAFEKIPPDGPLTMDHVPEVPAVAPRVTASNPQTGGVLSGPAKAAKQGLFELLKFTKIGLSMSPPHVELGSVPCEIGVLKLVLDMAPNPVIAPFKEMLELQPELNRVAQSVVSFNLKIKLPNRVFGSERSGMMPTFQIIDLVTES